MYIIFFLQAKCNVSPPSPSREQIDDAEEKVSDLQPSKTDRENETKGKLPKLAPAAKKVSKTQQRGVKTKALMRSKLQEKAVAKRRANKQLLSSDQNCTQSEVADTSGNKKQPPDMSGASKQHKQFFTFHKRAKQRLNLENEKHSGQINETSPHQNIEDLQATIDPFEFTDNEFESVLDNVICFNSARDTFCDDLPLAELAPTKIQRQSKNTAVRKDEAKKNVSKQTLKAKAEVRTKRKMQNKRTTEQADHRTKELKNTIQLPRSRNTKGFLKKGNKYENSEAAVLMDSGKINGNCELDETPGDVLQRRKGSYKKGPNAKLPQRKKQNSKLKQNDVRKNQRAVGKNLTKRKRKVTDAIGAEENSPIKRRKTRLSRKIAKEAKKNKSKPDGPLRKTVLSSKDMLDILEDVKNESKMKKKKRNRKIKPRAESNENENQLEDDSIGRKPSSTANRPTVATKQRKLTKTFKEEKDTIAEVIDQVAKVGASNTPKQKSIKLKIRLNPKITAISSGRKPAVKRNLKNAGRKRKLYSGKNKQSKKINSKQGKKTMVTRTKANVPLHENGSSDEKGSTEAIEADDLKNVEPTPAKRNPKIKTTDEVKKHMREEKPNKSQPNYDEDFKDAKLKLSVSPNKDNRLAKLIASVAKSLHMEVSSCVYFSVWRKTVLSNSLI